MKALPTALSILLGTLAAVLLIVLTASVPSFEQARASTRSSEGVLQDRNGIVIERLRLDRTQRMLSWTPLNNISPALLRAVVDSEDKRFWWHPGVDPIGITSALIDNLRRDRPRGASTISMQLAGLFNAQARHQGWGGKLQQMRDALAIELYWSKREILEAWLNRLPFRGDLIGIDAAARGLLAKGPSGLDDADAAVLAALIRAPSASRNNVARRACAGLRSQGLDAACASAEFLATGLPSRPYPLPGVDDAPHLARRLLQSPGEVLQTSLDGELQRFASDTLRTHLADLKDRNVEDGAVIVLDNLSGEVLAYVGSSGDLSGSAEVNGVAAQRQPGSTLKPFLYGIAIDQGWLTASSVLDDSPLALTTPSGLYIPQDYDRKFRGAVSVRAALGSSLNVPAVRALTLVGVDRFLGSLREFGLSRMQRDADHYGFGLALGAAETSLLELTNAYRALANGGAWSPVYFTPRSTPMTQGRQVLSPQASFIIGDILADPVARELTFGFSSALSTHTWAAVKTGTSKGMRDNWAIGFSDRYTVGVWVGNFSGSAMWDVSGITGAAPVWRDIIEHLHATRASTQPAPPNGVRRKLVSFQPAIEAPRNDWFIVGASDKEHAQQGTQKIIHQLASARAQLIAPPHGAIIAPDPDIPPGLQAILLQASGESNHCLRFDGKPIAPCGQLKKMLPLPAPGRHRLELVDQHGKTLDVHSFDVRAINAPAKHTPSYSDLSKPPR